MVNSFFLQYFKELFLITLPVQRDDKSMSKFLIYQHILKKKSTFFEFNCVPDFLHDIGLKIFIEIKIIFLC